MAYTGNQMIKLSELLPHKRNYRTHDAQMPGLEQSLERRGQYRSIVAHRNSDGTITILAGHGVAEAAKRRGMTSIRVDMHEGLTEEQQLEILVADNELTRKAADDRLILSELLTELRNDDVPMISTGWETGELDKLLDELGKDALKEGAGGDDYEPLIGEPRAILGDLWGLGEHRLLVGDCRDSEQAARLLNNVKVNVVVTSPPYAAQREYDKSSGFIPIAPDDYVSWYEPVQTIIAKYLAPDGSYFLNIKEHCDDGERVLYVKDLTIAHKRKWGWRFIDEFCWERVGLPGRYYGRFKNAWEPIFHFSRAEARDLKFKPQDVGHESDSVMVYSHETDMEPLGSLTGIAPKSRQEQRARAKGRETRIGIALPTNRLPTFSTDGLEHSAAYPIGLPTFFIMAFSDKGDVVYDPFMGSGSTLIACQRTGRKAYGCEISPMYADVILNRYEAETGLDPQLIERIQDNASGT